MSGSALMDALSDPGVNTLAGMAQGFAQAAMPTRMPTPIGAVLGMGAGGMMQGAGNAQRMQAQQQQIQGARMQNIATASGLPLTVARNQALTNIWQNPDLLQSMTNGSPMGASPAGQGGPPSGAAPVQQASPSPVAGGAQQASSGQPPSPQAGSVTVAALNSLPDDATRRMAINAAFSQGLPAEAIPAWISAVHNESGWNPKVPDNQNKNGTTDVGIGQVNSSNFGPLGMTADQLRDPQTNLNASAKLFGQQWQAAKGDPAGALAGYNGGNPSADVPGYVNKGMTRMAQWGYAGAPPAAAASAGAGNASGVTPQSALGMAQNYEAQANQLEQQQNRAKFWQGQGLPVMPPVGDPAVLRQAAQQYRALALAGPTSTAQEAGKAGVQLTTAGSIAAATAIGKASGTITNDRYGNIFTGDGNGGWKYLGRGSEVEPVWKPQTGQVEWANVGGTGLGQLNAQGQPMKPGDAPEPAAGGQAVAPPPTLSHFMDTRGTHIAEQFDKIDADAASAKEGNYLFDNLRNDSQTWDMGKFANFEGDARAWLSATAHLLGNPDPGLDKPLSDYQAFNKSSGMLLRTAVHDVSSRAAVQEYNLIGQTLPQPTTSAQGFGQIADQWQALNDFRLAKQQVAQGYISHPQDFNVDFNSKVSPIAFLINRMSQTPTGQSDMQAMFSRMQQTPEGRLAIPHMQQEYRYARDAGLFGNLPPTGSDGGAPQKQAPTQQATQ